jgi:hypothetical protein
LNAVENSKISLAWVFISTASNICQTLGYHRACPSSDSEELLQAAQTCLFWNIYRMEKALSLLLGRASTIRDSDVTLPLDAEEDRHTRLGRIQGMIYDQLYSVAGSTQTDDFARGRIAIQLAKELREVIKKTHAAHVVSIQLGAEPNSTNLRS